MSNNDLAIVILAAGKGTRLKSSLAKVLHRAGGRTLVEQIVRACEPLKARETVVVVGHQAEQVAAVVAPRGALTVLQRPQNGTGHAVQVAKRTLGRAKFAVVLPGDAPLVRPEPLKALVAAHHSGNARARPSWHRWPPTRAKCLAATHVRTLPKSTAYSESESGAS